MNTKGGLAYSDSDFVLWETKSNIFVVGNFKSHLQLKVGLVEELLAEYGGVLIDGSQEHSVKREKSCQPLSI